MAAQAVCELLSQAFLDLQAPGEALHNPGELREGHDALRGKVAHVRDPEKRQHVMFAKRVKRYIAPKDELVVPLLVLERRQLGFARRQ
jgi:hypothetical protein